MADLRDIYFVVGKNLFEKDFDHQTTEQKKKLVEGSLKTYVASKIVRESAEQAFRLSENPNISLDELVELLGELIPEEEHFDTIRHLTHFMLNIAGEMQGWSITWWDEQDESFVDNSLIKFNEDGKIDSLTTHKKTSYVHTFKFVHEIFQSPFTNENNKNKQYTLKDTRKPGSNN